MTVNSTEIGGDFFIGLDVQVKRGCPYYILDRELDYVTSGWLEGEDPGQISMNFRQLVDKMDSRSTGGVSVGIDAPRLALPSPRKYYWRKEEWVRKTANDRGYGRHCEVVIKALNIANPQWTPLAGEAPDWMELGFALFKSLQNKLNVYEVFPTASYRLLWGGKNPAVPLVLDNFAPGPKDMLDAAVAAFTVAQLRAGLGCEVGGGDGWGTIALPTELPVPDSHPVLIWPSSYPSPL